MELVIALCGASGTIYGIRMLEVLKDLNVKTHLIISSVAKSLIIYETNREIEEIKSLANISYDPNDLNAQISSGSYKTNGMIIIPCSMKTLAAIAHGYAYDLITRTADVQLKEKRNLVVVPREMPYNIIHLKNMLDLAVAGGIIVPASPGFYHKPKKIQDMIDHVVGKVLDIFGIQHQLYRRWHNIE